MSDFCCQTSLARTRTRDELRQYQALYLLDAERGVGYARCWLARLSLSRRSSIWLFSYVLSHSFSVCLPAFLSVCLSVSHRFIHWSIDNYNRGIQRNNCDINEIHWAVDMSGLWIQSLVGYTLTCFDSVSCWIHVDTCGFSLVWYTSLTRVDLVSSDTRWVVDVCGFSLLIGYTLTCEFSRFRYTLTFVNCGFSLIGYTLTCMDSVLLSDRIHLELDVYVWIQSRTLVVGYTLTAPFKL